MASQDLDAVKEKLRREAEAPSRASGSKRVTRRFTNEIGNPISILIEETEDTGKNHRTGKESTFPAVRIVVTGPTSMSENTLTQQEATELLACLARFKP